MTGRLWVLVERLNVSDTSDQLGSEESIILKLVVHRQDNHLDIFDLL